MFRYFVHKHFKVYFLYIVWYSMQYIGRYAVIIIWLCEDLNLWYFDDVSWLTVGRHFLLYCMFCVSRFSIWFICKLCLIYVYVLLDVYDLNRECECVYLVLYSEFLHSRTGIFCRILYIVSKFMICAVFCCSAILIL